VKKKHCLAEHRFCIGSTRSPRSSSGDKAEQSLFQRPFAMKYNTHSTALPDSFRHPLVLSTYGMTKKKTSKVPLKIDCNPVKIV